MIHTHGNSLAFHSVTQVKSVMPVGVTFVTPCLGPSEEMLCYLGGGGGATLFVLSFRSLSIRKRTDFFYSHTGD